MSAWVAEIPRLDPAQLPAKRDERVGDTGPLAALPLQLRDVGLELGCPCLVE